MSTLLTAAPAPSAVCKRPALEVADVFRQHGPAYRERHTLTRPQEKAMHAIEACRTAALIVPNAKIAQGFGSVVIGLTSGRFVTGTIQAEDDKAITLLTPEGKKEVIAKKDIDERTPATSAMPAMDRALSPRDLRDVIEYLSSLK